MFCSAYGNYGVSFMSKALVMSDNFDTYIPLTIYVYSADGNYEVSYMSNVLVMSDGSINWVPPAIYKSSCSMDVQFFPFDEQQCDLRFGSWTFLVYKTLCHHNDRLRPKKKVLCFGQPDRTYQNTSGLCFILKKNNNIRPTFSPSIYL